MKMKASWGPVLRVVLSRRPQPPSGRHRQIALASVSPTPTALLLHPPRGRGQRSRLEGGIGEGEVKPSLGEPSFHQAPGSGCPPSPWLDTWLQTSPSHPTRWGRWVSRAGAGLGGPSNLAKLPRASRWAWNRTRLRGIGDLPMSARIRVLRRDGILWTSGWRGDFAA